MTRMHNPPHPGEVLQDTVLRPDGGLTVTAFAKRLGVSRVALSRVVNGHAAISAELAIRLAAALGVSAESWLRMQVNYDLWHAAKRKRPRIESLEQRNRICASGGSGLDTGDGPSSSVIIMITSMMTSMTISMPTSIMTSAASEVPSSRSVREMPM